MIKRNDDAPARIDMKKLSPADRELIKALASLEWFPLPRQHVAQIASQYRTLGFKAPSEPVAVVVPPEWSGNFKETLDAITRAVATLPKHQQFLVLGVQIPIAKDSNFIVADRKHLKTLGIRTETMAKEKPPEKEVRLDLAAFRKDHKAAARIIEKLRKADWQRAHPTVIEALAMRMGTPPENLADLFLVSFRKGWFSLPKQNVADALKAVDIFLGGGAISMFCDDTLNTATGKISGFWLALPTHIMRILDIPIERGKGLSSPGIGL